MWVEKCQFSYLIKFKGYRYVHIGLNKKNLMCLKFCLSKYFKFENTKEILLMS